MPKAKSTPESPASVTRAERAGNRTMAPAQSTPGGPGDDPVRDEGSL